MDRTCNEEEPLRLICCSDSCSAHIYVVLHEKSVCGVRRLPVASCHLAIYTLCSRRVVLWPLPLLLSMTQNPLLFSSTTRPIHFVSLSLSRPPPTPPTSLNRTPFNKNSRRESNKNQLNGITKLQTSASMARMLSRLKKPSKNYTALYRTVFGEHPIHSQQNRKCY